MASELYPDTKPVYPIDLPFDVVNAALAESGLHKVAEGIYAFIKRKKSKLRAKVIYDRTLWQPDTTFSSGHDHELYQTFEMIIEADPTNKYELRARIMHFFKPRAESLKVLDYPVGIKLIGPAEKTA